MANCTISSNVAPERGVWQNLDPARFAITVASFWRIYRGDGVALEAWTRALPAIRAAMPPQPMPSAA